MYNKKIKKHINADKKAKFTKKPITESNPVAENISIMELMLEQDIIPTKKEIIKSEPIIITSSENDIPEIKINPKKIIKKPIKTKIKNPYDKSNIKKAKFTKKEIPIVEKVKPSEPIEMVTKTAILTTTNDDKETSYEYEVPKDESIVVINTPNIVSFEPPVKKENPNQIKIFEYAFNNIENKDSWTSTIFTAYWNKNSLPQLNKWVIDYYHPKNNKKQWYKIIHYFTINETDELPPFSPSITNSEGCI